MDLAINTIPRLTQYIIRRGFLQAPFVVVDVGVRGGISSRWQALGDLLEIHGFDPAEDAIAPLRDHAPKNHHYHAMALGNEDGEREFYVKHELYESSFFRAGEVTDSKVVPIRRLDTLLGQGVIPRADFIKLDCEGFEPEVLKGAQKLLQNFVIGIESEVSFDTSPVLPLSHFGGVFEQIAHHTFSLYDLAYDSIPSASFVERAGKLRRRRVIKWTRARPSTFNVLFFRNPAAYIPSSEDVLRGAIILELYGMNDVAFDLLHAYAQYLPPLFPLDEVSNLLLAAPSWRQKLAVVHRFLNSGGRV